MSTKTKELQSLYAVVGTESNGQEGIACYVDPRNGAIKPAAGGRDQAGKLVAIGQALSNASGVTLTMVRFIKMESLETFTPESREDPL